MINMENEPSIDLITKIKRIIEEEIGLSFEVFFLAYQEAHADELSLTETDLLDEILEVADNVAEITNEDGKLTEKELTFEERVVIGVLEMGMLYTNI